MSKRVKASQREGGVLGKKIQKGVKEKMQELNDAGNHDSPVGGLVQFFPTVQIEAL